MINILIVEDDKLILQLCTENLRRFGNGVNPILATSAEEAISLLRQHHIDGAFIDVLLPGMDGFSLASRIRDMGDYYYMPIIFETGEKRNVPDTYKEYRNIDFLVKPFTPADFLASANKLINDIKKQRALSLQKAEVKIPFLYDEGLVLIAFSDILYAATFPGRKIVLATSTSEYYRSNITLANIVTEINNDMFVQCHKAFVVNVTNIKEIEIFSRKAWTIYFQNAPDKSCQMSKKYKETTEDLLEGYRLSQQKSF